MHSVYDKINVSSLVIEPAFDFQSKKKIISLDTTGIEITISDLNKIRTLGDLEPISSFFEKYSKICNTLNIDKNDFVKWDLLLGKNTCKEFTKTLLKEVIFSKSLITSYHTEILPQRKLLYKNLTQIKDNAGNIIETPVYNHAGVSGRTSVKSGFNFLTSSKEFRSNCSSQKSENVLVSIDFKACEPNLYLRTLGRKIKDADVYSYLMSELGIKINDRSSLKRGILSVLYGAADDTARRILGGDVKSLEKIKKFFAIEETTKLLQREFNENGFIFNMYGRPIFSDHSILNKWIQSSAVDFCSLAFLKLSRTYNLDVAYLVHDDMVVDCSIKTYEKIKKIKEITDPVTNISLPVEITVISS